MGNNQGHWPPRPGSMPGPYQPQFMGPGNQAPRPANASQVAQRQQHPAGLPPTPEPDYTDENAQAIQWKVFQNATLRARYDEIAALHGIKIGADLLLSPLTMVKATRIDYNTQHNPGEPISLNQDTRSQTLLFQFEDPSFVTGVTATVIALQPTEFGQSWVGNYACLDPLSMVYGQFTRDGAGQKYQSEKAPLSSIAGIGKLQYFFPLIPVLGRGGLLSIIVSIDPPNQTAFPTPPFVESVGLVTIELHCERFNYFGV